jgi:hypothetical protein
MSTDKSYDAKDIDKYSYTDDSSRIRQFLWYCAGADVELLKRCPQSEHVKEEGIGGIVLATGGLAFISGSYAMYVVFSNHKIGGNEGIDVPVALLSVLLGFLWALVIFNLDRFIVSSVSHGDGTSKITWDEFKGAIPRLFMAIVIGLCLSTPLEIRVMKSEIEAVLNDKQKAYREKYNQEAEKSNGEKRQEIEKRRMETVSKRDQMIADIADKEKRIAEQDKVMNEEGGGKRGAAGIGAQYRAAKELREKLEQEKIVLENRFKDEKNRIDEDIKGFDANLDELTKELDKQKEKNKEMSQTLDGLIERITVAHDKYPVPSALLSLLLIIIEVAPIFFKMMLEKGPYELLVENQKRITQAKYAIESHSHVSTESGSTSVVGETFHQAELIGSYELGNLNVEKSLIQRIQENYERDTLSDIDKNPSLYVHPQQTGKT